MLGNGRKLTGVIRLRWTIEGVAVSIHPNDQVNGILKIVSKLAFTTFSFVGHQSMIPDFNWSFLDPMII